MSLKAIHLAMLLAAVAAVAATGGQARDNKAAAADAAESGQRGKAAAPGGGEAQAAAAGEDAEGDQDDGIPQEVVERIASMDRDKERLESAYTVYVAKIDRPAEGVVIPVEQHPDGSVKVDATAERAQFFEKEGYVWCGGVTVREYALDGSVKSQFHVDGCLVDRSTKTGWAEGRAVGTYGKTRLEGSGIYFSFSDESVKIYSKVVITSTDIKFEGVKL